jgi:hypothetical protein
VILTTLAAFGDAVVKGIHAGLVVGLVAVAAALCGAGVARHFRGDLTNDDRTASGWLLLSAVIGGLLVADLVGLGLRISSLLAVFAVAGAACAVAAWWLFRPQRTLPSLRWLVALVLLSGLLVLTPEAVQAVVLGSVTGFLVGCCAVLRRRPAQRTLVPANSRPEQLGGAQGGAT